MVMILKTVNIYTYLDMNNLNSWAMSEYFPYKGFEWLKNVDRFDVMSVSVNSRISRS